MSNFNIKKMMIFINIRKNKDEFLRDMFEYEIY